MDLDAIIWNSFSEGDRDLATSGLCGTFALALKEALPDVELALICWADRECSPKLANDGEPFWRHVVARFEESLFDIDGRVNLADVIENYCWGNPYGKGGVMVPVTVDELRAILASDRSFDRKNFDRWKVTLIREIGVDARLCRV